MKILHNAAVAKCSQTSKTLNLRDEEPKSSKIKQTDQEIDLIVTSK